MRNKICINQKSFFLLLAAVFIGGITVFFTSILNLKTISLKTRAAPPAIINVSPMPIQQNEFPSYAILNSTMDYYLPNKDNSFKYALNGSTICGGVLVGNDWVLTAAHCIEGRDINTLKIAFNISHLQGQLNTVIGEAETSKYFYKVEAVFPHFAYTSFPLYNNDIALIQIDRNVPSSIPQAKIPSSSSSYDVSKQLTIMGVGCVDIAPTPGLVAPYSADQYFKKYSLDVQKGYFNYEIKNKSQNNPEIYLKNPQNLRKAVCSGDSGSPMMDSGTNTVLGVVYSWVPGDFVVPGYGTLTYLRSSWLQSTMSTYDKVGIGCTPNTTQNYANDILQKVASTNKKLVINVRSKNDLYVVMNVIRSIKGQLDLLSNKEIQVNYSCSEWASDTNQETMTLHDVGTCSPLRRYESCSKLERSVFLRVYKNGVFTDDMTSLNSQYGWKFLSL